jgi:hypothetical protein
LRLRSQCPRPTPLEWAHLLAHLVPKTPIFLEGDFFLRIYALFPSVFIT